MERRIFYDPTGKLVLDLYQLQDQVRHGEIDGGGRLLTWQAAVKYHGEVVSYDSNTSHEARRHLDNRRYMFAIEYLLMHHKNSVINAHNMCTGWTPLHDACYIFQYDLVAKLL
jgi:hypothetical protein